MSYTFRAVTVATVPHIHIHLTLLITEKRKKKAVNLLAKWAIKQGAG